MYIVAIYGDTIIQLCHYATRYVDAWGIKSNIFFQW